MRKIGNFSFYKKNLLKSYVTEMKSHIHFKYRAQVYYTSQKDMSIPVSFQTTHSDIASQTETLQNKLNRR